MELSGDVRSKELRALLCQKYGLRIAIRVLTAVICYERHNMWYDNNPIQIDTSWKRY
jgi:hypothetical protein